MPFAAGTEELQVNCFCRRLWDSCSDFAWSTDRISDHDGRLYLATRARTGMARSHASVAQQ